MSGDCVGMPSLGKAGRRVEGAALRLLMDPGLARTGAFQAAWYQFPATAHLDQPGLLDCDYVTVSHEHLDHMDSAVLASLAPTTTVLIPRYPSPNFRDRLKAAGVANVVEVPAWRKFRLNEHGDWLTFITEQSPMCNDSA